MRVAPHVSSHPSPSRRAPSCPPAAGRRRVEPRRLGGQGVSGDRHQCQDRKGDQRCHRHDDPLAPARRRTACEEVLQGPGGERRRASRPRPGRSVPSTPRTLPRPRSAASRSRGCGRASTTVAVRHQQPHGEPGRRRPVGRLPLDEEAGPRADREHGGVEPWADGCHRGGDRGRERSPPPRAARVGAGRGRGRVRRPPRCRSPARPATSRAASPTAR